MRSEPTSGSFTGEERGVSASTIVCFVLGKEGKVGDIKQQTLSRGRSVL